MKKTICLLFAWLSLGLSQTQTLDRKYVPIIFPGRQIPKLNLIISEWSAFRFNAQQKQWTRVAFQVDEVDGDGKYNKEKDGVLDANDELLVMPEDLGDQASAGEWLNDPSSRQSYRIELTFTDPLETNKKGWLYLYRWVSLEQSAVGYHHYAAAPAGTAADTAKTLSYTIGHNRDGWINFVSLAANPQVSVVDRLKLRFAGETAMGGIGKYVCNEDTLNDGSSTYHVGAVRAFHDQRTLFSIPKLWGKPINADYQLEYYPCSFRIGVSGIQVNSMVLALAGLKSIRQSLDLSMATIGGKFFSPSNQEGALIDGNPDNIATAVGETSGAQWLLASGSWGTVLMILDLPKINKSITKIYYRDNQAGGTLDGSIDSGDMRSYGDMGLWVYTLASALVTDRINLDFVCYFINEPDQDARFAEQVFAWNQKALNVEYREQTFEPTAVKSSTLSPFEYHLLPGYPNPFNPERSIWQVLLHSSGRIQDHDAMIYDLLGRRLAVLTATATTAHTLAYSWDGRDESGTLAAPGIYFLRVTAFGQQHVQRILLSR